MQIVDPVQLPNKLTPRFWCFMFAQFLGAFNDNAFKMVVSLLALATFQDAAQKNLYLSLAGAIAIVPFVLFAGYAGYFADRYNKSRVLFWSKTIEVAAMGAALLLLVISPNVTALLLVLFLMATQSTFFSPAKYGVLPEVVGPAGLTRANGYLNMLTYLAIIFGTMAGGLLWQHFKTNPAVIGGILLSLAGLGTLLVHLMPKSPRAGDTRKTFQKNPWTGVWQSIPLIRGNRPLKYAVIGSFAFWSLAGILYFCLLLLGQDVIGVSEAKSSFLFSYLGLGIVVGSGLAGWRAGKETRLFLLPIGALLLSIACVLTYLNQTHYGTVAGLMILAGTGLGMFIVPIVTLIQKVTNPEERGQVFATSSFLDMGGVLLASAVNFGLHGALKLSPATSIALIGAFIALMIVGSFIIYPKFYRLIWRAMVAGILRLRYNINIHGEIPPQEDGKGRLVIANHVSYLDGILLAWILPRGTHFMVHPMFWKKPLIGRMLTKAGAIPFGGSVAANRKGLELTRQILTDGGIVCIFPEGGITRTGQLRAFKKGVESIAGGLDIDILPIYLHGLWGSNFSYSQQKFFGKWPNLQQRRRIDIAIGEPAPADTPAWQLHEHMAVLGGKAITLAQPRSQNLVKELLYFAKRNKRQQIVADSTGVELSYLKLLVGARLLAKHLGYERHTIAEITGTKPQKDINLRPTIGILLPGTSGAVLTNVAATMAGYTTVNLNFSLGKAAMQQAIDQAGITRIITARKFTSKLDELPDAEFIYLENFRKSVTSYQRITTLLSFALLPTFLLANKWLAPIKKDHVATIQFSSGSTAEPKGICLTHQNLLSNCEAIRTLLPQHSTGGMMAVLPLFHAFGYTVCQWSCLLEGRHVFFHPNPLEYKQVAKLVNEQESEILVATPTFAAGYVRAAALPSIKLVICGGEKLAESAAKLLGEKLPNAHILQGYGASETGPVVSCNIPAVTDRQLTQQGNQPGTVGMGIPGVAVRIIDVDTGAILPPGEEGLVLVKSPAVMPGYLNKEALTANVLTDGWYNTGDIGFLNDDGFLTLTDRLSRFSKIGGEMVPHGKIEHELHEILGHQEAAVIPDADDKLHVLYVENIAPGDLHSKLQTTDMPALWIPKARNFHQFEQLPRLPTGKLDLKLCKQQLQEMLS